MMKIIRTCNIRRIIYNNFKGNAEFSFLCNPQKSSIYDVCLVKILKHIVTKKVIECFYNLGEENF